MIICTFGVAIIFLFLDKGLIFDISFNISLFFLDVIRTEIFGFAHP